MFRKPKGHGTMSRFYSLLYPCFEESYVYPFRWPYHNQNVDSSLYGPTSFKRFFGLTPPPTLCSKPTSRGRGLAKSLGDWPAASRAVLFAPQLPQVERPVAGCLKTTLLECNRYRQRCMYVYVCICRRMYVYMHAYMCTCINICIYVYVYTYRLTDTHAYVYAYVYRYKYAYVHIHTRVYIYVCIHRHFRYVCIYLSEHLHIQM